MYIENKKNFYNMHIISIDVNWRTAQEMEPAPILLPNEPDCEFSNVF